MHICTHYTETYLKLKINSTFVWEKSSNISKKLFYKHAYQPVVRKSRNINNYQSKKKKIDEDDNNTLSMTL